MKPHKSNRLKKEDKNDSNINSPSELKNNKKIRSKSINKDISNSLLEFDINNSNLIHNVEFLDKKKNNNSTLLEKNKENIHVEYPFSIDEVIIMSQKMKSMTMQIKKQKRLISQYEKAINNENTDQSSSNIQLSLSQISPSKILSFNTINSDEKIFKETEYYKIIEENKNLKSKISNLEIFLKDSSINKNYDENITDISIIKTKSKSTQKEINDLNQNCTKVSLELHDLRNVLHLKEIELEKTKKSSELKLKEILKNKKEIEDHISNIEEQINKVVVDEQLQEKSYEIFIIELTKKESELKNEFSIKSEKLNEKEKEIDIKTQIHREEFQKERAKYNKEIKNLKNKTIKK